MFPAAVTTMLFSRKPFKLVAKKQIFVGKTPLKPGNTARYLTQYKARNLRSLNLHPAQLARIMSNSGYYILAPEMVGNGVQFNL